MRKVLILIAAVALLCSAVPAMAADWEFYGIAMFRTFWENDSKEVLTNGTFQGQTGPGGVAAVPRDDGDLIWGRQHDVEFGATVQAGDIGGKVAIRPLESHQAPAANGFDGGDFKELYGTWDFGAGQLLLGKTLGPLNFFPSSQVYWDDAGLVTWGGVLSYFKPLIQVSFGGNWGQLKIAALEPETDTAVQSRIMVPITNNSLNGGLTPVQSVAGGGITTIGAVGPTNVDNDTTLPKLEASYTYNFGMFSLTGMVGYQTYDYVTLNAAGVDQSDSVDSWIGAIGWTVNFGPVYFNGDVQMGQNTGNYVMTFEQATLGSNRAFYNTATNEVIDTDTWGFAAVIGWKINDMLTLEGGYGQITHNLDEIVVNAAGTFDSPEETWSNWYVQARITVSPGFMIIPEVGILDYGENEITPINAQQASDAGDTFYAGAQWRITF